MTIRHRAADVAPIKVSPIGVLPLNGPATGGISRLRAIGITRGPKAAGIIKRKMRLIPDLRGHPIRNSGPSRRRQHRRQRGLTSRRNHNKTIIQTLFSVRNRPGLTQSRCCRPIRRHLRRSQPIARSHSFPPMATQGGTICLAAMPGLRTTIKIPSDLNPAINLRPTIPLRLAGLSLRLPRHRITTVSRSSPPRITTAASARGSRLPRTPHRAFSFLTISRQPLRNGRLSLIIRRPSSRLRIGATRQRKDINPKGMTLSPRNSVIVNSIHATPGRMLGTVRSRAITKARLEFRLIMPKSSTRISSETKKTSKTTIKAVGAAAKCLSWRRSRRP